VQAPPSVRPSVEALRRHTATIVAQLAGLSRIELAGGSVTIDREVPNVLHAACASGSVLVVGEPGIGKSGALHELATRELAAGSDVVALQLEELEAASQQALARELGLERELAEVVAAWPGGRGVLIIDGLDAALSDHTRGALVEAIRRVLERAPRWRVVVSIRTFDLRHDPVLQRQFRAREGVPARAEWLEPEFRGVAHVRVGALSESEIAQLHPSAPELHEFVTSAPEAMRNLARVPFNLRLLAELLALARMPESELRDIDTQVGLLGAYWRERVLRPPAQADARERLLHRVCDAMIAERRLTIPRAELRAGDVDLAPLHPLLHDHVLVERTLPSGEANRERVGFAHNVLFDYAVARLLLSAPGSLTRLLEDDPSLMLRIRPSIEFHMRDQWNADAPRAGFWDETLALAGVAGLRELARTVGPAVAAERAREPADLAPLMNALDTGSAAAENAAQHIVGALMAFAAAADLVGEGSPWPAFADQLAQRLTPRRAGMTRALLATLLDHRDATSRDALAAGAAAARKLLRWAWDAGLDPIAESGIDAVRQTFATAPEESEALLRRVLDPARMSQHGYREMPRLTNDIETLIPHSPAFVADVYRAAFAYSEASEEKTPMGQSALMPMTSTKRQDYEMSHYALNQAFAAFLRQAPAHAVDALDAIVDGYVARRGLEHDRTLVRFRLGDRMCGIRADTSYIWTSGSAHQDEERMVRALGAALDIGSDFADALANAVTTGTRNAALWARLLTAAGRRPKRFAQRLGEVLRKTALYTMTDLQRPMAVALAALHPLLDDSARAAAEHAVLKVPHRAPADTRELREELRDGLLASLDAERLAAPAARQLRAKIDARGRAPDAPRPPFAVMTSSRSGTPTPAEIVAEQGADPTRVPNAKLLELSESVREFTERHTNEIPDTAARRAILTPLKRLWAALAGDVGRHADPPVRGRAWGHAAEAAAMLARAAAVVTPAAGRVATEILLAAAGQSLPTARATAVKRFDEFPSWGFPSPRISSAEGLTLIGGQARFATEDVLAAVVALSRDPSPAVRFAVARRVNALAITAPGTAWAIAEERASKDPSTAVLKVLLGPLVRLANLDEARAVASIRGILNRERRRRAPHQSLLDDLYEVLAGLAVWRDARGAHAALRPLLRDPVAHEPSVRSMLFHLRDALIHGPVAPADASHAAIRARAQATVRAALDAAALELRELEREHGSDVRSWPEDAVQRGHAAAAVADAVADVLFFASGVFQERHGSDEPHANPAQRARLYREAHDLLETLARRGHPQIVHHLVELLEGCIDEDPPGVFRLIAAAIEAGRDHGYQYEPLAMNAVVRIVERYLARHREVFEDDELAAALMDVLDVFVAVGWPQARRLVYGLYQLYR
jgi:hypothetical protein